MDKFGTILKETIERKGVTQRWVAEHADTTEATISRYTSGIHNPPVLEIVKNISKCLGVSVDYLIGASNCETQSPNYPTDIKLLMQSYEKASDADRNVIWAVFDKYLSSTDKAELNQAMNVKEGTNK